MLPITSDLEQLVAVGAIVRCVWGVTWCMSGHRGSLSLQEYQLKKERINLSRLFNTVVSLLSFPKQQYNMEKNIVDYLIIEN